MIRVLIAEDEPPTLRRIREMVERVDPAFFVAATALNGREALRRLAETHIDLVLTDIRMPAVDGLELMDEIQCCYPDCMVVVLSGYQDYEYMSRAMRARSLDYLLKPVAEKELADMLSRVKAQHQTLSRERLSRDLSKQLNKATPGTLTSGDAEVGVCLFCAGGMPLGDDVEMYPGANTWTGNSLEALAFDVVPDYTSFCWEFMGDTPVERILIFQAPGEEFGPWCQYLHEALLAEAALPISCACTQGPVALNRMNDTLKLLRDVLRHHIRIGRSSFVCLDTHAPPPRIEQVSDRDSAQKLAELLASGCIAQPSAVRRELFQRMVNEQWPQDRVARLMMDAASETARSMRIEDGERVRAYKKVLCDAACTALSFKELEQNICSLQPLERVDAGKATARQREVAEGIERYLRANYATHITNQTIGQVFGYVPSYTSLLFRQVYEMSPSEYLTQIRMREAKMLMQANPDMLIREVADRVGFKSQHHFSRTFKKFEGMWPSNYQS